MGRKKGSLNKGVTKKANLSIRITKEQLFYLRLRGNISKLICDFIDAQMDKDIKKGLYNPIDYDANNA